MYLFIFDFLLPDSSEAANQLFALLPSLEACSLEAFLAVSLFDIWPLGATLRNRRQGLTGVGRGVRAALNLEKAKA